MTINNSANISYNYGEVTAVALSNVATTNLTESYGMIAEKQSLNTSWRPNENISYVIKITNTGTEPLYGVSIQDNLGDDLTRPLEYIVNSAKLFRNNALTVINPTATAPLSIVIPDVLAPSETVLITYIARIRGDIDSTVSEITNSATIVGHETSMSGPTVTVTPNPSVTLLKASYADVRITKSADKTEIANGEKLTYTFVLENTGNTEATNVVIKDALPTQFTIESITAITNGIQTIFDVTDYSLDENNNLILPTSPTKTITVPSSTIAGNGITTVTVVGTINA